MLQLNTKVIGEMVQNERPKETSVSGEEVKKVKFGTYAIVERQGYK